MHGEIGWPVWGVMNLVMHNAHGFCFLDPKDHSVVMKDGKYVVGLCGQMHSKDRRGKCPSGHRQCYISGKSP
jgi:hypothetical protein